MERKVKEDEDGRERERNSRGGRGSCIGIAIPDFFSNPGISGLKMPIPGFRD